MSGLDVDSLLLMADGDEWQSLRKLDTEDLLELQLAKALWGVHTWMVLLGNGMIEADRVFAGNIFDVTTALGEALGQASVERPIIYQ